MKTKIENLKEEVKNSRKKETETKATGKKQALKLEKLQKVKHLMTTNRYLSGNIVCKRQKTNSIESTPPSETRKGQTFRKLERK